MVLGNDKIVPLGDDMRGELGDRCGCNRLKDVMDVNDVRLDLLHIWLNHRVRERVVDEGVHIWFQNMIMRCGNSAADRGVRVLIGVLTDEKRICDEPYKVYFEDKARKTSENTFLGLLFRGYELATHDGRNVRNMH